MAKFKKGLSDKVRGKLKKKGKLPATNPFEIKVNKVKHTVVNKKVEKWEKGIPGVSRSKAIKKRKDTILNEFHQMKKSNSLHDKRIGEKDSNLTAEEKMVQRFALERKMKTDKQSAFNLNEEEVILTHYGQSLAENLKDKPGSDSEDEDPYAYRDDTGKFQFGGFSANGEENKWKDKMQEVIAESKKQKYDRQVEKEKSFEATKELDGLWKSVVGKMRQRTDAPARPMTTFMLLSRSLVMEQKSEGAADKVKSEEQKAREESEKLKKLEAQRLERMKGGRGRIVADHVSADSLSNGYAVNKTGKLKVSFAGSDEDESGDESEEKGEDEDSQGEDAGSDEESGESSGDDDDDEDDDDADDSYSDLDDEEENDETDEESKGVEDDSAAKNEKPVSILKKSKNAPLKSGQGSPSTLPFTFEAPDTLEELKLLLHGLNTADQMTTISRLRKCYHPSLAEENKGKLEKIHRFLLQYYGEIVQEKQVNGKLANSLQNHLWDMTQTFPIVTAKFLQSFVLEKQGEYTAVAEKRGGRGVFPSMDTLAYLRLIEMLFPASDFRHQVTTPTLHFIAQMLVESSVRTLKDVTSGLYLCALCLQYVQSSKRYVPEVITFLHGVLYLASSSTQNDTTQVFPPFRKANKGSCQLELKTKCDQISQHISLSEIMNSDLSEENSNQLRCDLLNVCVELLHQCFTVWSELPCLSILLKPVDIQLKLLQSRFYPAIVKERVEQLTGRIAETKKLNFTAMQHESKRPEPLALFEPKIQENWSGKRKKGGANRDTNSRARMLHKYKREMKSAVREIKRDNAVLAKHKLDVTLKKDAERKRKVKEIMGSLANQEGDYKAMIRDK